MFNAIEELKEALEHCLKAQSEFNEEMKEADAIGDCQRANVCDDTAHISLKTIIHELESKIKYITSSMNKLQSRTPSSNVLIK